MPGTIVLIIPIIIQDNAHLVTTPNPWWQITKQHLVDFFKLWESSQLMEHPPSTLTILPAMMLAPTGCPVYIGAVTSSLNRPSLQAWVLYGIIHSLTPSIYNLWSFLMLTTLLHQWYIWLLMRQYPSTKIGQWWHHSWCLEKVFRKEFGWPRKMSRQRYRLHFCHNMRTN